MPRRRFWKTRDRLLTATACSRRPGVCGMVREFWRRGFFGVVSGRRRNETLTGGNTVTKSAAVGAITVAFAFVIGSGLRAQTAVACTPGAAIQFGSGWCRFSVAVDFKKGERLRLAIGGSATKILVRLLPRGADAATPIGVIPTPVSVPSNRFVEMIVPYDAATTDQISVHGGPNPWEQYPLGAGNGPATITGVEKLPAQPARGK